MNPPRSAVGGRTAAVLVGVAVVVAATGLGLVGTTGTVAAATNAPCTDNTGVTVVVDFHELGGGVQVRCAPQPVTDGFSALRQAGIDYQTTVRFPGFLCRIADKPSDDPCINASPASAYWSYWVAPRGGSWCYSNLGAGSRTPPPGSVEGWSFAKDKAAAQVPPPGYAPPGPVPGTTPHPLNANDCSHPATSARPTPPATTGPGPRPAPGIATAPAGVAAPGGGGAASGPGTSGSTAVPGGVSASAATRDGGGRATAARANAKQAAQRADAAIDLGPPHSGGSSLIGVIAAAAVVGALGGVALVVSRRRRRAVADAAP